MLKTPYSPLIAQLTDRAGMMVSPKAAKEAGDKFGLHPVCAGPYKFVERVQQDRMVFEKFADYWNKDNIHIDRVVFLPIVDATVRLANLKSGGLDLIERVLATDSRTCAPIPGCASTTPELGYQGLTVNIGNDKTKGPLSQSAKVRQALDLAIDREAINQVVFNGEFHVGNQWVSPMHPYYQKASRFRGRDVAKAKALLKEAGVTPPVSVDLHGPQGRGERSRRPRSSSRWPPKPASTSRSASVEFATDLQAGPGRRVPGLPDQLERPHRSRRQLLHLHAQQGAAERRRLLRTPRPTSCWKMAG